MKKLLFVSSILLCTNINAAPLEAFDLRAEPLNTIGTVNQVAYVTSNHHAGVRNNTDQMQEIRVIYTICAKTCDSSHWYRVKIGAHGEWQDGFTLHLTPRYGAIGNYQLIAKTQVIGQFGLNEEVTGYANIQVH